MSDHLDTPRHETPHSSGEDQPGEPATAVGAVWFFSGDLLFASRVQSAAQRAGRPFLLLGKWPESWTVDPTWVIVDLSTRSGAATEICQQAALLLPAARTIAYGPHVQPARLAKARQDGYSDVLTRGQFDAALPNLFEQATSA